MNAKVANLMIPSRQWKTDVVNQNFSQEEATIICNTLIGGIGRQDKLAWFYDKDGCYNVKSGYWIARMIVRNPSKGSTEREPSNSRALDWKSNI